jgi:hypothetical protein
MKKKLSVIILIFVCSLVNGSVHSNLSGGLSVRFDKERSEWHPGFNLAFAVIGKPVEYLGLSGDLSYSRWEGKNIPPGVLYDRNTMHYIRTLFVFQICYPIKNDIILQGEIGDGVAVEMDIEYEDNDQQADTKVHNGMVFGGGVILNRFSVIIRSNLVFRQHSRHRHKWVSFNFGFYY